MRDKLLHILKDGPHTTTQALEKLGFKQKTSERRRERKKILYHFSKLQEKNKVYSKRNSKTGEKTFTIQTKPQIQRVFNETYKELDTLKEAKKENLITFSDPTLPDATKKNKKAEDVITYTEKTERLFKETKAYKTLILPLKSIENNLTYLKRVYKETPRTTNIIYTWKPSKKHYSFLRTITTLSKTYTKKLYLLNKEHTDTYTVGKKGTYSLKQTYQSATIDLKKTLQKHTFSYFRKLAKEAIIHIAQNARKYNQTQNVMVPIRVWNYLPPNIPYTLIKNLLFSTKTSLNKLLQNINRENKQLGTQLTLNTELLPSFGSHLPKKFTKRTYKKRHCTGLKDIKQTWNNYLELRQRTASLFTNKDRCRIFRQKTNLETTPQEYYYIQTNYAIPLLCYDFRKLSKNHSLTKYVL